MGAPEAAPTPAGPPAGGEKITAAPPPPSSRKGFKVVIVGGGVGGLTLANVLERVGIDFVVLEAYREVAPQVGASIAMLPTALRVLDQIGCADAYLEGVEPLRTLSLTIRGKPLTEMPGPATHLMDCFGYGFVFNTRQRVLQVLWDNLGLKDKVLTSKRAVRIDETKGGVRVQTQDGDWHEGDIVVGLDGIRSFVRQEMWRIAAETPSTRGLFPADGLEKCKVYYRCLFGLAGPIKGIGSGDGFGVWLEGRSYMGSGIPGQTAFFLFEKLPQPLSEADAPRFGPEDQAEMAARCRNDPLAEGVTFGDVWDARISSGITPLHEHVFDQWHHGRIITLGDAAHKPHPNTGMGANGAVESVAALVNALTTRLDATGGGPHLSDEQVRAAFADVQAVRHERAVKTVAIGRKRQVTEGLESPWTERVVPPIMKLMPYDQAMDELMGGVVAAPHVEALPVPRRPRFVPFTDELPAAPLVGSSSEASSSENKFVRFVRRGGWPLAVRVLVALVFLALLRFAHAALVGTFDVLPKPDPQLVVKQAYTGLAPVDALLSEMTTFFLPTLSGRQPEHVLQQVYLLVQLMPLILIWTVESYRRGNNQNLLGRLLVSWPSIWAVLYQTNSIAVTGPVYFLLTLLTSASPVYHRTSGRPVDPSVARTLLPALAIGYGVPSALLFLPHDTATQLQTTAGYWQFAPVVVGPLTVALATAIRLVSPSSHHVRPLENNTGKPEPDRLPADNSDVPHLLGAYSAIASVTACQHLVTLCYAVLAAPPSFSLLDAFFGVQMPLSGVGIAEGFAIILRWDLIFYSATLLVWCLFTVFEMRRLGYVRTEQALRAGGAVLVALPLLGPGAMYAGAWYWRETVIDSLSKW